MALGGSLPFVFRLNSVRARLAWWQTLLAACLALPLVQPWKQLVADACHLLRTSDVAIGASSPCIRWRGPSPGQMLLLAALAAGVAARLIWLAIGVLRLRGYLNASTLYHCPLVRRMEVHAYVGLSDDVSSPVTFGWRRPVILFPAPLRRDGAGHAGEHRLPRTAARPAARLAVHAWCEEIVRAVFWFHPAIWWLLGEIQLTREQVVDREVVRLTQAREPYLNALVAIASARVAPRSGAGSAVPAQTPPEPTRIANSEGGDYVTHSYCRIFDRHQRDCC